MNREHTVINILAGRPASDDSREAAHDGIGIACEGGQSLFLRCTLELTIRFAYVARSNSSSDSPLLASSALTYFLFAHIVSATVEMLSRCVEEECETYDVWVVVRVRMWEPVHVASSSPKKSARPRACHVVLAEDVSESVARDSLGQAAQPCGELLVAVIVRMTSESRSPSAIISLGNGPPPEGKARTSVTQYAAGGLLRDEQDVTEKNAAKAQRLEQSTEDRRRRALEGIFLKAYELHKDRLSVFPS
ncbi:hypothetical protein EIP86_005982 [Pleurotus ostreatoroseus]|nr:hypothetical protein EIP86_005982 [Pleurotus ostreatoroseus]